MASPGQLVSKVAESFGIPRQTVVVHDRNLVEAGLRTKGGRGRSAANMSADDAANLLIAVAGSSLVKDAVDTVSDYGTLPSRDRSTSTRRDIQLNQRRRKSKHLWLLPDLSIPQLRALSDQHTFGDAVVALIESSADGSLNSAIEAMISKRATKSPISTTFFQIEVAMFAPYPQARIHIYWNDFGETHFYGEKIPIDRDALSNWEIDIRRKYGKGDLTQIREFTWRTICEIGELLRAAPEGGLK